jgi:ketosteroid isomerase-like protein
LTTKGDATAEQILTLERTALNRWGAGDPDGFLETYAEDVTYFDPVTAARLDGHDAMTAYYRPWIGKIKVDRYEILNPSVVVADDIAVLAYNLVNFLRDANGTERLLNRWNSTTVYQRHGMNWKIVHSHWSFTQPTLVGGNVNADAGLMA